MSQSLQVQILEEISIINKETIIFSPSFMNLPNLILKSFYMTFQLMRHHHGEGPSQAKLVVDSLLQLR